MLKKDKKVEVLRPTCLPVKAGCSGYHGEALCVGLVPE